MSSDFLSIHFFLAMGPIVNLGLIDDGLCARRELWNGLQVFEPLFLVCELILSLILRLTLLCLDGLLLFL